MRKPNLKMRALLTSSYYHITLPGGVYELLNKYNRPIGNLEEAQKEAFIQYGNSWLNVYNHNYIIQNKCCRKTFVYSPTGENDESN